MVLDSNRLSDHKTSLKLVSKGSFQANQNGWRDICLEKLWWPWPCCFSADRGNACLMGRLHPSLIITVNELREVPHVCWYNLNIWTPQFILAVCFNSPLQRILFRSSKREEKIWPISYQLFSQDLQTKLWPHHTLNSEPKNCCLIPRLSFLNS